MAIYGEEYWLEEEKRPGLDFDTEIDAKSFQEWLVAMTGNRVDQSGRTITVPEGVGCGQDTLSNWRDDWEQDTEEADQRAKGLLQVNL
jgi:hypothetical protein